MAFWNLNRGWGGALVCVAILGMKPALATPYEVFAKANSSVGGVGLGTITLAAGESFSVSVNPSDLWSAGALPRYSNADGLQVFLAATGADESGLPAGTTIGAPFPNYTHDGFTAPYGSLVGVIGSTHILLGTSYTGLAPVAGLLNLYYWNSNNSASSGSVIAEVHSNSAVPEPGSLALMALGLLPATAVFRRKSVKA